MQTLQPRYILYTPDALNHRGQAVLERYSDAERIVIKQHNRLPDLGLKHFRAKSDLLVLGRLKTLVNKDNGRSADYIAPSLANGCFGGCTYCYVDRNKPLNPITLFTNTEEILAEVDRHALHLPWPRVPAQTDPTFYVYDIGCNSDVSVDAQLSDAIRTAVAFFRAHPRAKGSFATKFVNRDLLTYDPQRKTRIRFTLLPPHVSKLVDVRTDPVAERLAALNDFYDAGYEVHVNFSPVIVYGNADDRQAWRHDYRALFRQLDASVRPEVKAQMKCEVIFLTHNVAQHALNQEIHPQGEALLWRPELQETKTSQYGGENLRYRHDLKRQMITIFRELLQDEIPWCEVRYIF
ncbi:spore photoproduct lyase family protein [Catalinimonas alkaloidigena]|uniref:Spore photoproduct lyase family protein n=1 Tax=Catalinimonas alkaloidigena TaxID=1075417 RepID=A0A1G9EAN4_9BACT|nr:spore photoproduct lyase family protein [Catalinimonas alkaloidigena]SDK73232.1 spore photoproduct lyase family protein [Catalinimonas alkaloidigena]